MSCAGWPVVADGAAVLAVDGDLDAAVGGLDAHRRAPTFSERDSPKARSPAKTTSAVAVADHDVGAPAGGA